MSKTVIAVITVLSAVLAGCTYTISDPSTGKLLATCHDGALTSFCVVKKDAEDGLVSGAGIVPTANTASGMVTESVAVGTLLAK